MLRCQEEERKLDKCPDFGEKRSMREFQPLYWVSVKSLHRPERPLPPLKNRYTNIHLRDGCFIRAKNIREGLLRGEQRGQNKRGAGKPFSLSAKFKGAPRISGLKIDNVLMHYF